MTTNTATELSWVKENAEEHVHLVFDAETGQQSHLMIMDGEFGVLNDIDKNFALALAARLVELAIELPPTRVTLPAMTLPPEKRRTVRRLSAVDEQFREMEQ